MKWMDLLYLHRSQFLSRNPIITNKNLSMDMETEINYQRHMLETLVVGSAYSFIIANIGGSISSQKFLPLLISILLNEKRTKTRCA